MGIPANIMAGAAQTEANGSVNGAPSSYAAKFSLAPHFIGGNHLQHAAPGKVKDFVAAHDGHTVITSVSGILGRNRGNWRVAC
jgi:acetyl-CoA carboxylase/biotin carboxylase 1